MNEDRYVCNYCGNDVEKHNFVPGNIPAWACPASCGMHYFQEPVHLEKRKA